MAEETDKPKKDSTIVVGVTEEERQIIVKKAEEAERGSLSNYCRLRLLDKLNN